MRNFDSLIEYCHLSQQDKGKQKFYNSSYMDAFSRVENYEDNNHNGHFQQLFYAIYDFLKESPNLIGKVTSPPFEIFDNKSVLNKWCEFLSDEDNSCVEYDISSLIKNLPPKCGGVRSGGGGWALL